MAKLVIYEELDGEETIFEDFELSIHRILIGSHDDNNLVLDIPDIDPVHASLELRNDFWVLQDLGGPGGTLVNGLLVDGPTELNHNDLIELHTLKIRFEDEHLINSTIVDEETAEFDEISLEAEEPAVAPIRGRVWFGTIAGLTLVFIFTIIFGLIILDYLDVLKLSDLLPFVSG